jgi:hypothetical protein
MSGLLVASAGIGGRLLTVGNSGDAYGFGGTFGSLTPREFLSANINLCGWEPSIVRFGVNNPSQANGGWSTLNINGTVFTRADASYSGGVWWWTPISNPFGTTVGLIIPVNIA